MSDSQPIWSALLLLLVAIVLRLIADNLDRGRIRERIEAGGGKVLNISWNPLGPGWFGSRERIYDVRYETRDGVIQNGTCKTSLFSGVYWTEQAPPNDILDPAEGHAIGPSKTEMKKLSAPDVPMTCFSCGGPMTERQTRCPRCGWSYMR